MSNPWRSRSFFLALVAGLVTVGTSVLPTVAATPWGWKLGGYLTAMGLFIGLMATTMWPRACQGRRWVSYWPYFGVQIMLLGIAEFLMKGGGITWLASMPLLGQISSLRRIEMKRLAQVGWMLALFLLVSWFKYVAYGPVEFLYWVGPMVGCYVFVYGFTWMAMEADARREESERLAQELVEANARLQLQSRAIEGLTQERERARVARELHDSLGHTLTALAVQLEVAEALPDPSSDKARQAVGRARVLAQSSLQDVREAVRSLRETRALRRLEARVKELVTDFNTAGGRAEFTVKGDAAPLANDAEQALFRTAQEALTNVQRHCRGAQVRLVLDYLRPGAVALTVEDDGQGTPGPAGAGSGFGLRGLRERMEALGGSFASGRQGAGFALRAEVPR